MKKIWLLKILLLAALLGCTKKVDLERPVLEVQTEAEDMSVRKLKKMSAEYNEVLAHKYTEVEALKIQLLSTPMAGQAGAIGDELRNRIKTLTAEIDTLQAHLAVFASELKARGEEPVQFLF